MNSLFILLSILPFLGSFASVSSCGAGSTSCDHASSGVVISKEEALFVSQLSADSIQAFNLMTIDQRHQAVEIARKEGLDADAAVDAVLKKHHLAVVGNTLKTTRVH